MKKSAKPRAADEKFRNFINILKLCGGEVVFLAGSTAEESFFSTAQGMIVDK